MALMFLAAYADGHLRMPAELAFDGKLGKKRRVRWKLPQPPWFQDRVASARGRPGLLQTHYQHPTDAVTLLVRVSPGVEYTGPLTNWTIEHDLFWTYLGQGLDSYSMQVDMAFHVLMPLPLPARGSHHKRSKMQMHSHSTGNLDARALSYAKTSAMVADVAQLPITRGSDIKSVLQVSEESWQIFLRTRPVLWIPEPLALLVGRSQWSTLMFRAGWDEAHKRTCEAATALRRQLQWPSAEWLQHLRRHGRRRSQCSPRLEFEFAPRHADAIVALLRQAAPAWLGNLDDELRAERTLDLEDASFLGGGAPFLYFL